MTMKCISRYCVSQSATMVAGLHKLACFALCIVIVLLSLSEVYADYRLGAGDVVKIVVYDHEDLTTEDRITDSGTISIPFLGEVALGGLSKSESETLISNLLIRAKLIKNPQVSVRILQFREPKVSVLGQVNRPGRYPVEPFKTVLDVLADAGGLNAQAEEQVLVLRREGQKTVKFKIDLRTTIGDGNLVDVLTIRDGDIISVPKAAQFYVYGAVQHPGVFRLEHNMTVIQALSVAGGLSVRGSDKGLMVRRLDNDKKTTVELSVGFKDMLRADDVLVVKESLF